MPAEQRAKISAANTRTALPALKRCPRCEQTKEAEFFRVRTNGRWLHSYCKACEAEKQRGRNATPQQRLRQAEWNRQAAFRRKGMTEDEYNDLLISQGGGCGICGETNTASRRLFVDHCHESRRVRGLLCTRCNFGVGYFRDQATLMERAAEWVRREPTPDLVVPTKWRYRDTARGRSPRR